LTPGPTYGTVTTNAPTWRMEGQMQFERSNLATITGYEFAEEGRAADGTWVSVSMTEWGGLTILANRGSVRSALTLSLSDALDLAATIRRAVDGAAKP